MDKKNTTAGNSQNYIEVAKTSFELVETGNIQLASQIIHPSFSNTEAEDDPEDKDRQLSGSEGFLATGNWLRKAFSKLKFEIQETAVDDDTVFVASLMIGRHTGVFQGIPPTEKVIRQKQVHIFKIKDEKIIQHRAVRDDLGLLMYLGWKPKAN